MSPKEVVYGWYVLFIVIVGTSLLLFLSLGPTFTPTGQAITFLANPEVSAYYEWNFATSADYTYDSSLIVVNGTAQLKSTTTVTSTTITDVNESLLTSALEYEDDDDDVKNRTNKVNSLGSGNVELDDGEVVLAVTLNQQVQNNDTLSLYLLSGTDGGGKIYLCNDSSGCSTGEYGNLTLPGSFSVGWYNLTLSGVPSLTDTLFLDSPDKIKIDLVKGYKRTTRTETNTTITYPSSASLQTADLQPTNIKRWEIFSKEEQLHGQTMSYSYSTDSGSTWATMPTNGNLSAVSGPRIRFKVDFSSNTTDTGIVDTLNLTYTTQQPCVENWTASYGVCLVNDSKLLQYTDTSDCSTTTSLPADNGTYVSCDYCTPSWREINGSCTSSDTFIGWYNDSNSCYSLTGLPSDNTPPANKTYSCDYCVPQWNEINSSCRNNDTIFATFADSNSCYAQTGLIIDNNPPANKTYTCDYCTPSWREINGSCRSSDTFIGWYNDSNVCYVQTSLVSDNTPPANNTYPCDYCNPSWQEVNSSCRKDNLIVATFMDSNTCYSQTGLGGDNHPPAAQNYTCNYCALNNCSQSLIKVPVAEVRGNKTIFKMDAISRASTLLEIEGTVGNATVSIVQYSYNTKNETPSSLPLNRYVDLEANISNLSAVKIILYYTDEELTTAGITEETITIYYYNETVSGWQKLNSTVNSTGNYVYATVPHLSLYGIFGDQNAVASDSDSSVHGGGGRKGINRNPTTPAESAEVREVFQPVLETGGESGSASNQSPSAEAGCNYVLELSLPEQISIEHGKPFEGEVVNTGNCDVPLLALELSAPLVDYVSLNVSVLENIKPGAKGTFLLIRRQQKQADFFSLTSSVISSLKGSETRLGFVRVRAQDVVNTVFEKELPVTITINEPFPFRSFISAAISLTVISLLGAFFYKQRRSRLSLRRSLRRRKN